MRYYIDPQTKRKRKCKACKFCNHNIYISKETGQYRRSIRNKQQFCNLKCKKSYFNAEVLPGSKRCSKCNNIKLCSEFYKNKAVADGLVPFCKDCNRQYNTDLKNKDPRRKILKNAIRNAWKKNLELTIKKEDIVIPQYCPMLKIKLDINSSTIKDNSASIDRIDSNKGYIPDNIQIISHKANTIKSNATVKELGMVYEYMKDLNNV